MNLKPAYLDGLLESGVRENLIKMLSNLILNQEVSQNKKFGERGSESNTMFKERNRLKNGY